MVRRLCEVSRTGTDETNVFNSLHLETAQHVIHRIFQITK